MKSILIIGLGRFGSYMAKKFAELGNDVMVMDTDEERVNELLPYVTSAQIGDATKPSVLEALDVESYDLCVVSVGENFQSSLEATSLLKEAGAKRTVMLNVSGPFHSPMLKKAGEELAQVLEGVELSPLAVPYVTNVTAQQVTDIGQTKALLAEQVSSSVRWQQSMENLIAEGVDTFVEIGPGRTLAGFMRKISRDVTVYNVGAWADVEKVAQALK